LLSRSAALAQLPALTRARFDLPIEAIVSDRLVLIQRQAEVAQGLIAERAAE
jgi:hypothetical protein